MFLSSPFQSVPSPIDQREKFASIFGSFPNPNIRTSREVTIRSSNVSAQKNGARYDNLGLCLFLPLALSLYFPFDTFKKKNCTVTRCFHPPHSLPFQPSREGEGERNHLFRSAKSYACVMATEPSTRGGGGGEGRRGEGGE